jgi:hypothetical protein
MAVADAPSAFATVALPLEAVHDTLVAFSQMLVDNCPERPVSAPSARAPEGGPASIG